jgi:hypothetical protein
MNQTIHRTERLANLFLRQTSTLALTKINIWQGKNLSIFFLHQNLKPTKRNNMPE